MFRQMLVLAVMGVISSVALANGASFQGIGPIEVRDVSADGNVVVGRWAEDCNGLFWTEATGLVDLGYLPGVQGGQTEVYGVSADGSVIVGYSGTGGNNIVEAFRWTQATGKIGLCDPPTPSYMCFAYGISDDSSKIVGQNLQGQAIIWNNINQITTIWPSGCALRISSNGVVVGASLSRACRWTESTGVISLGTLPGGAHSAAKAVSADGSTIVGGSDTGSASSEAFRWTQSEGMVGLGGGCWSEARDVTADGSIVVGMACYKIGDSNNLEAFIWDANRGMLKLKDVLENGYGLDLSGWQLGYASGISADGLTIVGTGSDPNGDTRGWVARLGTSRPVALTISVEPNNIGINTVTPGIGRHIYYPGWLVTLNAGVYTNCPDAYSFNHWIGNVSDSNAANTTIVMMEDKSVTAVFSLGRRCGDECHPILQGDLNKDCYVNLDDFAIYCAQWLACTHPDCD